MIKGYQYQSDFARKYVEEGRQQGREQGREEGRQQGREQARDALRREIVELVSARLPGIRDELASRLRDQPEAVLVRVALELGKAPDEDGARAMLAWILDRRR